MEKWFVFNKRPSDFITDEVISSVIASKFGPTTAAERLSRQLSTCALPYPRPCAIYLYGMYCRLPLSFDRPLTLTDMYTTNSWRWATVKYSTMKAGCWQLYLGSSAAIISWGVGLRPCHSTKNEEKNAKLTKVRHIDGKPADHNTRIGMVELTFRSLMGVEESERR